MQYPLHEGQQLDSFDPDNFTLSTEQVARVVRSKENATGKKSGKRQPIEKLFALCPLEFTAQALAAIGNRRAVVLLYLLHSLRLRGNPVHVSQKALSALGVSRKAKDRTLKLLEERGLISVTRKRGRCPLVIFLVEVYQ
jgi:DNA-binding HxlR family transcriptional regulator